MITTYSERQKTWAKQNRGVFSRIARQVHVTPNWVRQVYYGVPSRSGQIEQALAEAGAPGMAGRVRQSA